MAKASDVQSVVDALVTGQGVQQGEWYNIACDDPGTRSLAVALGCTQAELDTLLSGHALKN